MFNSPVKTTRDFWRKKYPDISKCIYLRDDASFEITKKRTEAKIRSIPKRPRFGHWSTMYWTLKSLAKEDNWYYTQMDLCKRLWREDLIENCNRHRS